MPAPSTLVRVLDELLWVLRREGFDISTSQAIDAARAVMAVGLDDQREVRDSLAAVVVHRASERARFDATFARFFDAESATEHSRSVWDRLSVRGFQKDALDVLRELMAARDQDGAGDLAALAVLLERGQDLDRSLLRASVSRRLDAESGPQLGFLTHRLFTRIGVGAAQRALSRLRSQLAGALGSLGEELAQALAQELELTRQKVRGDASRQQEERTASSLERPKALSDVEFVALSDAEVAEVRLAVRRFAQRLRGGVRVRARRRFRRGRVDGLRTMRQALRTGGTPFDLVRKERRPNRPKLVLLCDVSDSVRTAACFLLEFMYAVQDLLPRTRSFVFVSDIEEATEVLARQPIRLAIARVWGGRVGLTGDNSNYGRVLRTFEALYAHEIDRETTVVVLGDGRTNFHDAAPDVLDRIRRRARALLWLCPEPRGRWGQGDSAMVAYASKCTYVYEVRCAADLERAARSLVARR